jgi:hypothetical protein
MATIVQNILNNVKSTAATVLGATYKELRYVYAIEKNDLRSSEKAYSCRPLSASPAESIVRHYTLDHQFELVLTDTVGRSDDDSQRFDILHTMYDKADEIFKELVNTKLSLSSTVLNVASPSMSEPEFINDNKLVILRMQFTVKYRSEL